MINRVIEGKRIGELEYNRLAKEISTLDEPKTLQENRMRYLEQAMLLELPGKPDEAWRRINLSQLDMKQYTVVKPKISITNPNHQQELAGKGVIVKTIDELIKEKPDVINKFYQRMKQVRRRIEDNRDPVYSGEIDETLFFALSEALFNCGVFVKVPQFVTLDKPITITIETEGDKGIILPQIYFHMEEGSKADVLVEYASKDEKAGLSVGMSKGILEEGSNLDVLTNQNFNQQSMGFHNKFFVMEKDARLNHGFIQTGGKTSMCEHKHTLLGKGAEVYINGLIRSEAEQFIGNKVTIRHYSPNTDSEFKAKSVLQDSSRVLFLGNIKMPKLAQRCNGHQSSDNLLLGERSKVEAIPQLEIIADDVKCSHGATVGSIDKDKLFYLETRGITEDEAVNMIVKGYYQDILDKMEILKKHDSLYEHVTRELSGKLGIEFDNMSLEKEMSSSISW
jgi:Fe-S cluster assembly protein SufD